MDLTRLLLDPSQFLENRFIGRMPGLSNNAQTTKCAQADGE